MYAKWGLYYHNAIYHIKMKKGGRKSKTKISNNQKLEKKIDGTSKKWNTYSQ